jgi:tetratricopeptide (TPR) repeat protein
LEIRRRSLSPTHPEVTLNLSNLAALMISMDRQAEAVPLLRQVVDTNRETLGDAHAHTGVSLLNLARALSKNLQYDEADRVSHDGIDVLRRAFGDRHPDVAAGLHNLAAMHMATGRLEEAEPLLRETLDILAEALGDTHPLAAHCRDTLGVLLLGLDRPDEAMPLFDRALADRRQSLGDDHAQVGLTWKNLAVARFELGDIAGAIEAAENAIVILREYDTVDPERATALLTAAEAHLDQGDPPDEVEAWIQEAIRIYESDRNQDAWRTADAMRVAARWFAYQGDHEKAQDTLRQAANSLDCDPEPSHSRCNRMRNRIANTAEIIERKRNEQ